MKNSIILAGIGIFVAIAAAAVFVSQSPETVGLSASDTSGPADAEITIPEFTAEAAEGSRYFAAACASCHGQNGVGTEKGPPLVHDIYNPGHHSDESFLRAAKNGVPQHHWPYGNMPPQKVTRAEMARIITYIRELQVANGITYRPHNM